MRSDRKAELLLVIARALDVPLDYLLIGQPDRDEQIGHLREMALRSAL